VKNVYVMRLSSGGATVLAVATTCKKDIVSSLVLFARGYEFYSPCDSAGIEMLGQKESSCRRRSRELTLELAAISRVGFVAQRHRGCGHDCLRLAENLHDMKEVENAQETSDHDGR